MPRTRRRGGKHWTRRKYHYVRKPEQAGQFIGEASEGNSYLECEERILEQEAQTLESKTCPLKLDWKHGPHMPVAMSQYIQSVEIAGMLYVGGGHADNLINDNYLVMAYNVELCEWHTLPPCGFMNFAMTCVNNKLVLVGGLIQESFNNYRESNELAEWQIDSFEWTHPFPPMSKPCSLASATFHKHWLVVAGGYYANRNLSDVQVLDVTNMQWSTRPSIPVQWRSMKSATIGDTWYLMGGYHCDYGWGSSVYSVSLEALVASESAESLPESSSLWQKLPSINCARSCPVNVGNHLLAVGGMEIEKSEPLSTIQRYIPEAKTWVPVGNLHQNLAFSTCITISDKIYVMGGNDTNKIFRNMFTSTIL